MADSHAFGATAGRVMFVTGAALTMSAYATVTFIGVLATVPPQALLQAQNRAAADIESGAIGHLRLTPK